MSLPDLDSINYTIALLTLAGLIYAIWRSKERRRSAAVAIAILGDEEVTDRAGQVIRPASPGLVAVVADASKQVADASKALSAVDRRVSKLEEAVVGFQHTIALYTELAKRVDTVENEVRILKDSTVERVAIRLEAAQAMRWAADEQGKPPAEPFNPPEEEA